MDAPDHDSGAGAGLFSMSLFPVSGWNEAIEAVARKLELAQYRDITEAEFIAEIRSMKRGGPAIFYCRGANGPERHCSLKGNTQCDYCYWRETGKSVHGKEAICAKA